MPSETVFLDAIREAPDNKMLRRVYADWLDDLGDPRGELIRMQCDLEELPARNPERHILFQAIQELCSELHAEWLAPLKKRVLGWTHARFHLGLVENVKMSPTAFLKHAETGLFEEMPLLSGIWLEGRESSLETALASPFLNHLGSLTLTVTGSANSGVLLHRLTENISTRHLVSLNLYQGGFGDKAIAKLLQSPNFPRLRKLNLQNNNLTETIAQSLVDSPLLPQLELLALGSRGWSGSNVLGDVGVRRLMECRMPLQLRWLDLADNNLSDSSAWDLTNASCLDNLELLCLGGNLFSRVSQTALADRFPKRVDYRSWIEIGLPKCWDSSSI